MNFISRWMGRRREYIQARDRRAILEKEAIEIFKSGHLAHMPAFSKLTGRKIPWEFEVRRSPREFDTSTGLLIRDSDLTVIARATTNSYQNPYDCSLSAFEGWIYMPKDRTTLYSYSLPGIGEGTERCP